MMNLKRGKLFAGFRIVERLGTSVFEVEDPSGRHAALRILERASADAVAQCFSSACAASQLAHPAIAQTYDLGTVENRAFIVTELIDGESVARRLARKRGALPLADALSLARRIASALAVAHDAGVAHGALSPENIIIGDRKLALIGFGLAALGGGDPMSFIEALPPPIYSAPEQCRATSSYETTSDLYALGCILFELLAGHPPFRSKSWGELVTSHLMEPPPPLPPSVPRPIRDLVTALLAKCPSERPTASYAVHALAGSIEDLELSAIPRAPWRWLAAFAITLSLVVPRAYAQTEEKLQSVFHNADLPSLPL